MRAVTQDRYGPSSVLEVRDRPVPEVGDEDVLLRVRAAGVDRGVWHLMTGLPYVIRLGFGLRAPRQPVLGLDVAGVVETVGANVTDLSPGDEVFGVARGSFAEFAIASPAKLIRKPVMLSFEEAAAVPVSGITALQAVIDHGEVGSGDHVLVTGASGGVGSYAVALAKARGATVTGVCRGAKADFVRSLGADHVVDYTREDVTRSGVRFDRILDIGGNRPLRDLRRVLTERGTLVIVGGEEGGAWFGGIGRSLVASFLSSFVRQQLKMFVASESRDHLARLVPMLESGEVRPRIHRIRPLEEAAAAIDDLTSGDVCGKVVLRMAE